MPRSFKRDGRIFDRVTIDFTDSSNAAQVRAFVHDVLICAHGYNTARRLTKRLAMSGGRFRVAIARYKVRALRKRLLPLIRGNMIALFVAGQRVRLAD